MALSFRIRNTGNHGSAGSACASAQTDCLGPSTGQLSSERRWVHFMFGLAVFLIAAASVYDAYLVYKYREGIIERNPVCDWLIRQEPESVSLFLAAKGAGTAGVVSVLIGLFAFWRRAGITAAISLVIFQSGLMYYLHTSEISRPRHRQTFATLSPSAGEIQPIEENKQVDPSKKLDQREKQKRAKANRESRSRKRALKQGRIRPQAKRAKKENDKSSQPSKSKRNRNTAFRPVAGEIL